VLTEDPPRPRSLEPSIPEPLELIIQRSMAKQPQDRYQSMEELDADLAAYDISETELVELSSPGLPGARPPMPSVARGAPTVHGRKAQEVSMARPLIVLLTGLGLFWVAGSLITLITAIVRLARGGAAADNLTGFEAALLGLGIGFTLITPAILFMRFIRRSVWDNSAKAVDFVEKLRRPVVVGLCGYGFAALMVRTVEAVVLRRAAGVAWPMWDVLMFVIGAAGAIGAHLLFSAERPRSG
jgi:serine/threonine-protein kinase